MYTNRVTCMGFLRIAVPVAGVIALLVQAGFCLFTKRPNVIGFVNLLLALVVSCACLLLYSGDMVLGSEFGLAMVRGSRNAWLLRSALVCVALVPGLTWHCIRRFNEGWRSSLAAVIAAGCFFGGWAASRVEGLAPLPFDPESLRVYTYDVWWPPLMVWITVCFACSVLALVKVDRVYNAVAAVAATLVPIASFALHFEELADPQSYRMWQIFEYAAFGLFLCSLAYAVLEGPRYRARAVAGALGLTAGFVFLPNWAQTSIGLMPAAFFVGSTVFLFIEALLSSPRPQHGGEIGDGSKNVVQRAAETVRSFWPANRVLGAALAFSLPIIAVGLTDLFSVGILNRTLESAILIGCWLVFVERLAEGALEKLPTFFRDGVLQLPFFEKAKHLFSAILAGIRKAAQSLVDYFKAESKWVLALRTLLAAVFVIFGLTIAVDVLNSQATIVQFQWTPKDTKDDVSQAISDGVVNSLGRLRSDLRTDLLQVERKASGEHPHDVPFLTAVTDDVGASIAKSDDLTVGGIKIPVKLLVGPIQDLTRSLLGIRVIRGSVQTTTDGKRYVVTANASDGTSWREFSLAAPEAVQGSNAANTDSGGQQKKEGAAAKTANTKSGETQTAPPPPDCPADDVNQGDRITELVERLAFDIASSDPKLLAAGITRSRPAFEQFRSGLAFWNRYDTARKPEYLGCAIKSFRAAVGLDQKFALAYYRLGIAMQEDGQPEAAVEAFRSSVATNPSFVRGALSQAETLYNYQNYYLVQPAILTPIESKTERRREALRIWTSLLQLPADSVSVSEHLNAYYGICQYDLDNLREVPREEGPSAFYLPYFYCSAAAALGSRTPIVDQDVQERTVGAAVLNLIGVSLDLHHQNHREFDINEMPWSCAAGAIHPGDLKEDGSVSRWFIYGSRLSSFSLKYYRRSLELSPDDPAVRCNFATSMAYFRGNSQEMQNVSGVGSVHLSLASTLVVWAHNFDLDQKVVAGYYHHAMDEFDSAMMLDSASIDAHAGYSHAYWLWQVDWQKGHASVGPTTEIALAAERSAREAIRLASLHESEETKLFGMEVLGEVLLAQGRVNEAIEELEKLETEATKNSANWPGLVEARWDLAQARICSSNRIKDESSRNNLIRKAVEGFSRIRKYEQDRDYRPFSEAPPALDPFLLRRSCTEAPDSSTAKTFPFEMRAPSYSPGMGCDWSGVVGEILSERKDVFVLHVWGGGLDNRISLMKDNPQSISIELPHGDRQSYYYAQLEDSSAAPVSPVRTFEAYEGNTSGGCPKNLIKLAFDERVKKKQ